MLNTARTLALSLFALTAACSLTPDEGVTESEDQADFLSQVVGGKVMIVVNLQQERSGDVTPAQKAINDRIESNAEDLIKFYRETKDATVTEAKVRSIEEFYDNSRFEDVDNEFPGINNNLRNHPNSLLELERWDIEEKGAEAYDRVIVIGVGNNIGPVFSESKMPGYNHPVQKSASRTIQDQLAEDKNVTFNEELFSELGRITKPQGWIYFTGVNPDEGTAFAGFNDFLEYASCLSGRHTMASRVENMMWAEQNQIERIEASSRVKEKHTIPGFKLQSPCDMSENSSIYTCNEDLKLQNTCGPSDVSFFTQWGSCRDLAGECVNTEAVGSAGTVEGQCPGPVEIRCKPASTSESERAAEPDASVDSRCSAAGGVVETEGYCIETAEPFVCNGSSDASTLPVGQCMAPGQGDSIKCCPDAPNPPALDGPDEPASAEPGEPASGEMTCEGTCRRIGSGGADEYISFTDGSCDEGEYCYMTDAALSGTPGDEPTEEGAGSSEESSVDACLRGDPGVCLPYTAQFEFPYCDSDGDGGVDGIFDNSTTSENGGCRERVSGEEYPLVCCRGSFIP